MPKRESLFTMIKPCKQCFVKQKKLKCHFTITSLKVVMIVSLQRAQNHLKKVKMSLLIVTIQKKKRKLKFKDFRPTTQRTVTPTSIWILKKKKNHKHNNQSLKKRKSRKLWLRMILENILRDTKRVPLLLARSKPMKIWTTSKRNRKRNKMPFKSKRLSTVELQSYLIKRLEKLLNLQRKERI